MDSSRNDRGECGGDRSILFLKVIVSNSEILMTVMEVRSAESKIDFIHYDHDQEMIDYQLTVHCGIRDKR